MQLRHNLGILMSAMYKPHRCKKRDMSYTDYAYNTDASKL